jgi:hypothetical protein
MNDSLPTTGTPWWRNRTLQLATLLLLVCLGVSLRLAALDGVVRRTPDERAYTQAAKVLLAQGAAGMPVLVARAAVDTRTAANPVRAGYLFLLADAMRLTGRTDERAGAELACAASIVSVLLLALLAWHRFSPTVALTATLLYAVSPAALMTARRAWEEAVAEAVVLLLILVASEITAGSRHPAWAFVFAATGAFAITVKQTATIGFALCAVWVLVVLISRRERRNALLFAGLCAVASLAAVGWLALLLGGLHHVAALLAGSTNSLEGNAYSIAYEHGSPWSLIQAFAIVSAPTLLLALLALCDAADPRHPMTVQRRIVLALFGIGAAFLALVTVLPHHINLRHLAPLFAPAALLAGVGMSLALGLIERLRPGRSGLLSGLAVAILVAAAALDDTHFRTEFAQPDVQDLSLRMVLAAGEESAPAPPMIASPAPEGSFDLWIAAAVQASRVGDCQKTVDAATHAVQIDANSAIAWNDLAAGFECSRQWPSAIAAARHALQLQPDFQLARNNLNWSLEQQAKEAAR